MVRLPFAAKPEVLFNFAPPGGMRVFIRSQADLDAVAKEVDPARHPRPAQILVESAEQAGLRVPAHLQALAAELRACRAAYRPLPPMPLMGPTAEAADAPKGGEDAEAGPPDRVERHDAESRLLQAKDRAVYWARNLWRNTHLTEAERRRLLSETEAGRAVLAKADEDARPPALLRHPPRPSGGGAAAGSAPTPTPAPISPRILPAVAAPARAPVIVATAAERAEAADFAERAIAARRATPAERDAIAGLAAQALADDRQMPRPAGELTRAQTLAAVLEARAPVSATPPARRQELLAIAERELARSGAPRRS